MKLTLIEPFDGCLVGYTIPNLELDRCAICARSVKPRKRGHIAPIVFPCERCGIHFHVDCFETYWATKADLYKLHETGDPFVWLCRGCRS